MKEMSVLTKSSRERERPIAAVALIGAVWLVILSGAWAFSAIAPTPAKAPAVYGDWVPPV
jgi:hypothetical protein